jgi:hypothetical protein
MQNEVIAATIEGENKIFTIDTNNKESYIPMDEPSDYIILKRFPNIGNYVPRALWRN